MTEKDNKNKDGENGNTLDGEGLKDPSKTTVKKVVKKAANKTVPKSAGTGAAPKDSPPAKPTSNKSPSKDPTCLVMFKGKKFKIKESKLQKFLDAGYHKV